MLLWLRCHCVHRGEQEETAEEGVEYVKLPPLLSELSRSASLQELADDAAMNIDLLQVSSSYVIYCHAKE
jgi:hypothetical protein